MPGSRVQGQGFGVEGVGVGLRTRSPVSQMSGWRVARSAFLLSSRKNARQLSVDAAVQE
jgi:hypothetical protein